MSTSHYDSQMSQIPLAAISMGARLSACMALAFQPVAPSSPIRGAPPIQKSLNALCLLYMSAQQGPSAISSLQGLPFTEYLQRSCKGTYSDA